MKVATALVTLASTEIESQSAEEGEGAARLF